MAWQTAWHGMESFVAWHAMAGVHCGSGWVGMENVLLELLGMLSAVAHCCRFADDQPFTEVAATRLETMDVVDGSWCAGLVGLWPGNQSCAPAMPTAWFA